MIELKPCPFCGAKAAFSVLDGKPGEMVCAWVECTCGVATIEGRSEEDAAERWNRRVSPALSSTDQQGES